MKFNLIFKQLDMREMAMAALWDMFLNRYMKLKKIICGKKRKHIWYVSRAIIALELAVIWTLIQSRFYFLIK